MELSISHAQEAPEKRGLVQQLQFWRRDSSKSSEPEEAHESTEATEPMTQQLPSPQHLGEQDGALDDVDALMARLAEQQVSQHTSRVWCIEKVITMTMLPKLSQHPYMRCAVVKWQL